MSQRNNFFGNNLRYNSDDKKSYFGIETVLDQNGQPVKDAHGNEVKRFYTCDKYGNREIDNFPNNNNMQNAMQKKT